MCNKMLNVFPCVCGIACEAQALQFPRPCYQCITALLHLLQMIIQIIGKGTKGFMKYCTEPVHIKIMCCNTGETPVFNGYKYKEQAQVQTVVSFFGGTTSLRSAYHYGQFVLCCSSKAITYINYFHNDIHLMLHFVF